MTARPQVAVPVSPGVTPRKRTGALWLHLALLPLALIFLAPLWIMAVFSTHPETAIFSPNPPLWFGGAFMENFRGLQADTNFLRTLFNSTMIASLYTVFSMLLTSMGGYAFAKFDFPGKNWLFGLILATLTIPTFVTIIPQFILVARDLKLSNTYWAVILPTLANTIGIFYMRQAFQTVPSDLLNAARIDGASEGRIFWQIALPIVRPALAALAILLFLASWNDYLWPLIVLTQKDSYTMPVALGTLVGLTRVSWGGIMVGTAIATIPFLVLFLSLQRHFVAGIAGGAVKD
ncbi:sn-glycerol-3-phosphate transport system permease protein UgpE [Deinococcus aerolatus]|uniref:Sn-glycerol-3-phosphate transport system permease protein UgpE n=2 Tax=Deinococcus TaxID=1298 RepID=A0ABQ2GTF1_9DEIO|nr:MULTISPECIES: carbohydrate ABC transporter permease [Deinococcus]GGL82659.1 sn-glycerol-3-phosphate transport system permease protein UgpE [Deinococcus aerolatus]GGM10319.1 sn-glycerol-3-phosphate transport system permease protein UgpE [Deinococcus aerophilus]